MILIMALAVAASGAGDEADTHPQTVLTTMDFLGKETVQGQDQLAKQLGLLTSSLTSEVTSCQAEVKTSQAEVRSCQAEVGRAQGEARRAQKQLHEVLKSRVGLSEDAASPSNSINMARLMAPQGPQGAERGTVPQSNAETDRIAALHIIDELNNSRPQLGESSDDTHSSQLAQLRILLERLLVSPEEKNKSLKPKTSLDSEAKADEVKASSQKRQKHCEENPGKGWTPADAKEKKWVFNAWSKCRPVGFRGNTKKAEKYRVSYPSCASQSCEREVCTGDESAAMLKASSGGGGTATATTIMPIFSTPSGGTRLACGVTLEGKLDCWQMLDSNAK